MKCLACDCLLTDKEAVRRYAESLEFVDLCNHCFDTVREDVNAFSFEDECIDVAWEEE